MRRKKTIKRIEQITNCGCSAVVRAAAVALRSLLVSYKHASSGLSSNTTRDVTGCSLFSHNVIRNLSGSFLYKIIQRGFDPFWNFARDACIGVRANLHVGKLVERFDCIWDEDHHVYSYWHFE